MKIKIVRDTTENINCTPGTMYLDGVKTYVTLERPAVSVGPVRIPPGTYKVKLSKSVHLGYMTPEVLDVPGRTGIRIHIGNKADDSEGCVLVGLTAGKDYIYSSRKAFNALMEKLKKDDNIILEIV